MLNSGMFTSDTSEWATPQDFFDKLNAEFHFTLDPCATPENAKCGKFYTKEQNGLAQDWTGETVFCNPPYGKEISAWVEKCYKHSLSGECAVMLIPSRTDTRWFHEWVYGKAELRFVKGRLRFNDSKGSAPFPSLVVVYRGATHEEQLPPAQLGTDLISRQAALDALRYAELGCEFEAIETLPSAQPEQQWIPCSERLPEDYTDVLVWFEYYRYGDYNCLYQMHGIGNYMAEYDSWMINHETGWRELRVFAWMPLPAPWKGERDG